LKTENKENKQEDKVMKTKNNVQKAVIKSLAIVISLVLISFTVSAQNFWKALLENNSLNEIAMFMVETKHAATVATEAATGSTNLSAYAAYTKAETEEALNLEDWMTNDNYFLPATFSMADEIESPLELESWMTSDNYFDTFSNLNEVDAEKPLELESWMTNTNYFIINTYDFENETEQPLNLENWMVDNNYWKK